MSSTLYQIANSNYVGSGSIGFGTVVSKFGRVAGRSGFQIEPDNDTANAYLTSRYASMSLFNPVLVLIPSATSGSTLYTLYNRSESGDFIVTNNGSGSRVNRLFVIATGSAARANTARFNYSRPQAPFSSSTPGLLVEPQRINLVSWSEAITSSRWSNTSMTTSFISTTNPLGVTDNVAVLRGDVDALLTTPLNSSNPLSYDFTYNLSCFFKISSSAATTFDAIQMYICDTTVASPSSATGFGSNRAGITILSGSILGSTAPSQNGFSVTNQKVVPYGNGWFRLQCSSRLGTNPAFRSNPIMSFVLRVNGALFPNKGILAWGAQCELASISSSAEWEPTSYIPTSGSAITRTGDTATTVTLTVPSSSTGGTIYSEFISSRTQSYYVHNVELPIVTGSNRIAVTYISSSIATYNNGIFISSQSGTYNIGGNTMDLGHISGSYQLNDNLLSYAIYNYALTPTQAITLTT